MLLAPLVLAAALGQSCPQPASRYGPPPCAVADVPGCIPGYRRDVDAYGRTIYVCETNPRQRYAPPPAAQPPPRASAPEVAPAPPPPPYPPPAPPRYQPWSPAPAYGSEPRGLLGIVLAPGATTVDHGSGSDPVGNVGLELRFPVGGARLRLGYEFSQLARSVEIGVKYDFLEFAPLRPFLAVGVGGATLDGDLGWGPSASFAGGLDVYLARDVFATFELKGRVFGRDVPDGYATTAHQTTFLVGIGFFL